MSDYKPRSDSWAGRLTEDEQCAIFERWLRTGAMWNEVAEWAVREYPDHMAAKPSQTAMYVWRERFRPVYNKRQTEKVRDAGELVAEYARANAVTDEQYVAALKAIASRAMVANDAETMAQCIRSAMEITAAQQKRTDLDLKARAQATKEADLALAREKFEYDAAKKAMQLAAEIKTVSADDALDDDEKIKKVREALFG